MLVFGFGFISIISNLGTSDACNFTFFSICGLNWLNHPDVFSGVRPVILFIKIEPRVVGTPPTDGFLPPSFAR